MNNFTNLNFDKEGEIFNYVNNCLVEGSTLIKKLAELSDEFKDFINLKLSYQAYSNINSKNLVFINEEKNSSKEEKQKFLVKFIILNLLEELLLKNTNYQNFFIEKHEVSVNRLKLLKSDSQFLKKDDSVCKELKRRNIVLSDFTTDQQKFLCDLTLNYSKANNNYINFLEYNLNKKNNNNKLINSKFSYYKSKNINEINNKNIENNSKLSFNNAKNSSLYSNSTFYSMNNNINSNFSSISCNHITSFNHLNLNSDFPNSNAEKSNEDCSENVCYEEYNNTEVEKNLIDIEAPDKTLGMDVEPNFINNLLSNIDSCNINKLTKKTSYYICKYKIIKRLKQVY